MSRARSPRIHFLTAGGKKTVCGRAARATTRDTQLRKNVTCKTCLRVLAFWDRVGAKERVS
jgi:hypothetical protein